MEFQVILTPVAEQDLEQIGRYIAGSETDTARRFCAELIFKAESLRNFPHRHGSLTRRPNIRKFPYGNYLIFYKIYEDTEIVEILRFWHAAQDRRHLRLKEESPGYILATNPVG